MSWLILLMKFEDRYFYLCWLNKSESQFISAHVVVICAQQGLKSQTCLAWKSPFLSQLGIGIVKRSSCVRVFDASLSNALCSSARHGACRRHGYFPHVVVQIQTFTLA